MPVYRVECANRTTGSTYPVIIESLSAKDAADYCVAQGHLVGRVLAEVPHFPITGANGDPHGTAHAEAAAAASHPPDSSHAQAEHQPAQNAAAIYAALHNLGISTDRPAGSAAPSTDAELLRDIADRLAKLQRSPIIARPVRTIAYGMTAGFSLMWAVGLLFMLLLVILGITLPLGLGGGGGGGRAGARPAEGINASELQRVQDLLKP